jgi:hypothetical protein
MAGSAKRVPFVDGVEVAGAAQGAGGVNGATRGAGGVDMAARGAGRVDGATRGEREIGFNLFLLKGN